MSERLSLAEVLYPTTTPDTTPSQGTALTPPKATPAETTPWSGNVTDIALFGRDHPRPSEMYSPEVALRPTMQQRQNDEVDTLGFGEAARIQQHREFVAMVRESGGLVDAGTAGADLYDALIDAQVAAARGGEIDDAKDTAVRTDIRRELRDTYGAIRAEKILNAVDAAIQASPRLTRLLNETPGIITQSRFRKAFDQIVNQVRKERLL